MSTLSAAVSRDPAAPRAHHFGVSTAMVTPFAADGTVDLGRAAAHARRLLGMGADGVTLFGTTGEGASLGMAERQAVLDSILEAGVAPAALTVCLAASDPETLLAQANMAFRAGVRRVLLPPPFYFKGISETALYDWVSQFVDRTAAADPEIILYHIPQVTAVRFDAPLVRRIKDAHGKAIFGIKDSEGNWDHSAALLPFDDLVVLIGDERLLARAAPLGGAGAISGMANLYPQRLGRIIKTGVADPLLDALVDDVVKAPVTPLVKALVGVANDDPEWARTRLPLEPARADLVEALAARVRSLQE